MPIFGDFQEHPALRKTGVVLLILLVSLGAIYAYNPKLLSITPGFEGEQNGIWGYQPSGQTAQALDVSLAAPSGACSYAWNGGDSTSSGQINSASPGFLGCGAPKSDSLVFSTQTNPISYIDQYTQPIQVGYKAPVPNQQGKFMLVKGQVNTYTFTTNVAIGSSSSGAWAFSGDTTWFNLLSLNWNNAISLTLSNGTSIQGQAFETPLYMVATACQWTNQSPNNAIGPCQAGGSFGGSVSFYNIPSTGGVCGTLAGLVASGCGGSLPGTSLNSSLSSVYAPDTRMQRLVYYPVTITHMQNACGGFGLAGCNPPSVTVTFKLYTLLIGEYILTNPDKQSLTGSTQGCTGFACTLNGLWSFVTNPFNQLGLLLASLGIVAVVLLVFGGGTLVALALILSRRKGNG